LTVNPHKPRIGYFLYWLAQRYKYSRLVSKLALTKSSDRGLNEIVIFATPSEEAVQVDSKCHNQYRLRNLFCVGSALLSELGCSCNFPKVKTLFSQRLVGVVPQFPGSNRHDNCSTYWANLRVLIYVLSLHLRHIFHI